MTVNYSSIAPPDLAVLSLEFYCDEHLKCLRPVFIKWEGVSSFFMTLSVVHCGVEGKQCFVYYQHLSCVCTHSMEYRRWV